MPARVKQFGAGVIISGLLFPIMLFFFYKIYNEAERVPMLERQMTIEVKNLNKSIQHLQETAQQTNDSLKAYTKFHAANLSRITEALVDHKYKLQALEKDCNKFNHVEKECEKHLLKVKLNEARQRNK